MVNKPYVWSQKISWRLALVNPACHLVAFYCERLSTYIPAVSALRWVFSGTSLSTPRRFPSCVDCNLCPSRQPSFLRWRSLRHRMNFGQYGGDAIHWSLLPCPEPVENYMCVPLQERCMSLGYTKSSMILLYIYAVVIMVFVKGWQNRQCTMT